MGDLSGLVNKIHEVIMPNNQPPNIIGPQLVEGTFTLRLLYEMFQTLQSMGPLGQVSYPFIAINVIKFDEIIQQHRKI
jgi:signal recognition particle subunit SRP54